MANVDPLEIPGGPRTEDRPSRTSKDFLKVTENLDDTWLANPLRKGFDVGDWDLQKESFPPVAKPLTALEPKKKSGPGRSDSIVPQEVPMIFTDSKASDLLHSDSGLELSAGKISLNNSEIFVKDFLMVTPQDKKLLQIEKVNLQAVGKSLAACTITKSLRAKLSSLLQGRHFQIFLIMSIS